MSKWDELDKLIEMLRSDAESDLDYRRPHFDRAANAMEDLMKQNRELLYALNAAVECGIVPSSSAKDGGAYRFARQVIVADMIRAAIRKATGEEE